MLLQDGAMPAGVVRFMQKVTDELDLVRGRTSDAANPLAPDVLQLAAALDRDRAGLQELRDNYI
ncbi:MAG: hypothetical protein ABR591_12970, partial [Candidatus Velthaea sp.]